MLRRVSASDVWSSAEPYERYVGRWSRLVAREFLAALAVPPGSRWLDVGSGTAALAATIVETASPGEVVGVDSSERYVEHANAALGAGRTSFLVADAASLPFEDASFDAAVAGLVVNFLPDPARGVEEMARVVRPGGAVGAYVWDYGGEMQLMRSFWDAALELDPSAVELDEGRRFPVAQRGALGAVFEGAGLAEVETRAIDVPTRFRDFDDYWTPFLGGQGPAPGYATSLPEKGRIALRETLRARLPTTADGSIELTARAWAAAGRRPA